MTLIYNTSHLKLLDTSATKHGLKKFKFDNISIRPSHIDDIVSKIYEELAAFDACCSAQSLFTGDRLIDGAGFGNIYDDIDVFSVNSNTFGIGTTTPNEDVILDIQSTSKPMLIPRISSEAATAISSPVNGMLVYVLDSLVSDTFSSAGLWIYVEGAWTKIV